MRGERDKVGSRSSEGECKERLLVHGFGGICRQEDDEVVELDTIVRLQTETGQK